MTSESAPPQSGSKPRSPALVAVIAVVAVIVLAGGAYAVYKLTNKHTRQPAVVTAKAVFLDLQSGKGGAVAGKATPAGLVAIGKIDSGQLQGLVFGRCGVGTATDIRVCTWSRPGGQLAMTLKLAGDTWKVTDVQLGAAGLPPTGTSPST